MQVFSVHVLSPVCSYSVMHHCLRILLEFLVINLSLFSETFIVSLLTVLHFEQLKVATPRLTERAEKPDLYPPPFAL